MAAKSLPFFADGCGSTQLRNASPASGAGRGREDARPDGRTRLPQGGRCGRSDAPHPAPPRPSPAAAPLARTAAPAPPGHPPGRPRPGGPDPADRAPPAPGPHPPPTRAEARRAQPWLRRPRRRRGQGTGRRTRATTAAPRVTSSGSARVPGPAPSSPPLTGAALSTNRRRRRGLRGRRGRRASGRWAGLTDGWAGLT